MTTSIPDSLRTVLEQTQAEPHPVAALRSSRALFKQVSDWQARMVVGAIETGATWEEVGEALGTTRQAAWARFRGAEGTEPRSTSAAEVKAVSQEVKEQLRDFQVKLKDFEEKWRDRQADLKNKFRELERGRREERKQLHDEMRSIQSSLRDKIQAQREPPSR
ncbi:MAG: hypothetical protein H0W21_03455 [Actinobacteria bacterium]|nr:hypothetical protein [Actinomycetota bacterium]